MAKEQERVQVGSLINKRLWQQLRAQALLEGRTAGEVLDEAISDYLKKGKNFNQG